MKKFLNGLFLVILCLLPSCKPSNLYESNSSKDDFGYEDKRGKVDEVYNINSIYVKLEVIVGDKKLEAILFDNQTSRSFAEMLPLTIEIWQPALGFASAFDLPQSFPYFDQEPPQRGYELGSLAYWMPGPSIAMIYNDDRYQTVVPVVPIGKINGDIRFLENYEGTITIEIVE